MTDFLDRWSGESEANAKLVAEELLIAEVTEAIWEAMENDGISKTELARRMGASKGYVSQVLSGSRNMTLRTLAVICADLIHRRELFLLEAEHVSMPPLSLDERVENLQVLMRKRERMSFGELVSSAASTEEVVVTFLAILELYKRGYAELRQEESFGDIEIVRVEGEAA